MKRRLKLMLVMQNVPLDSGFLSVKFLRLSDIFDTHLLVWDSSERIQRYKNSSANNRLNIHNGIHNARGLISNILNIVAVLFDRKVFKFIVSGEGSFTQRLKFIMSYLPIFRTKPDIIHFEFGALAAKCIKTLKSITSAKISVSFRGYDINYLGLADAHYYDDLWTSADGIHFLGQDLKNRAIKRGYKDDKLSALIPPAIDINMFQRAGNKNYVNDKLIIISTGRLVWKKGIEYGVRAVSLLKEKGIPFEYRIIGDGDFKQAIQFTIFELGLNDEVKLLGKLPSDQVKKELEGADVFLHPAISEGFCNAVLEAQAMGVPVICTDADGLSENVDNNKTGFVVAKWDVEAMADKLMWCYNNRDIARQMGEAGIARVKEKFLLENQVKAFESFYRRLYES